MATRRMMTICTVLSAAALLVGCAQSPEDTLPEAEAKADALMQELSADEDNLGSFASRVTSNTAPEEEGTDYSVTLDAKVRPTQGIAACFGKGKAEVSFSLLGNNGSKEVNGPIEIECDGTQKTLELDETAEGLDLVRITASAVDDAEVFVVGGLQGMSVVDARG